MSENQATFPVTALCRTLGVSTSGYYAWRNREPSDRKRADDELLEAIREVHNRSRGTYGALRIQAELRAAGRRVGRKRIGRLMRRDNLRGVSRRRWVRTTTPNVNDEPRPDLVDRDFSADGPNRLWVSDITYIPTASGFLLLAVVVDAWS